MCRVLDELHDGWKNGVARDGPVLCTSRIAMWGWERAAQGLVKAVGKKNRHSLGAGSPRPR